MYKQKMGHSTSSALCKWPSLGPPNYDLLCIDLIVHKGSMFFLDPLLKDPPLLLSPIYNSPSFSPLHKLSFLRPIFGTSPMAATAGSLISMQSRPALGAATRISSLSAISLSSQGNSFLSFRLRPVPARLRISCAAKPETLEKVCSIVKKQLALADDITVSGESKFAQLGADSLDTVEIVMGLEEEFGISVEEESAQSIATVQDAAELIEKLVAKKST